MNEKMFSFFSCPFCRWSSFDPFSNHLSENTIFEDSNTKLFMKLIQLEKETSNYELFDKLIEKAKFGSYKSTNKISTFKKVSKKQDFSNEECDEFYSLTIENLAENNQSNPQFQNDTNLIIGPKFPQNPSNYFKIKQKNTNNSLPNPINLSKLNLIPILSKICFSCNRILIYPLIDSFDSSKNSDMFPDFRRRHAAL